MKIIYVSMTDPDAEGGVGAHLYGMSAALVDRGETVTLVCPTSYENRGDAPEKRVFTVRRLRVAGRGLSARILYDLQVARLVWRARADVLVQRLNTSLVVTPLVSRLRSRLTLFEVNGPTWSELRSERRNPISVALAGLAIRLQLRSSQGFLAVTPKLRDHVARYAPAIEVPNGVDLDEVPHFAGGGGDIVRMGFAGAFTQWYDLDLVLDSIEGIEGRLGRRVHAVLVGGGVRQNALQRRVEADPLLRERVVFKPWCARLEALEIMSRCDVGIIPLRPKTGSDALGSPLKLFDYLAIGIPTVLPPLDGCTSVASELVHYYASGDREGFTDAVCRAVDVDLPSPSAHADLRESISWDNRAELVANFARAALHAKAKSS